MSSVLITGANGFVGKALCRSFVQRNDHVFGGIRDMAKSGGLPPNVTPTILSDSQTSSRGFLENVNVLIHLASRVHVMRDDAINPLEEFRKVNVRWTQQLAESAAECGVNRFVYVSSIKVHGEGSRVPYNEHDFLTPMDPYAISKLEAEKILRTIGQETGLEVVIIRPPLVYGPEVKANFLQLLKIVHKGVPLPLARIDNQRSLVYLENLVDSIYHCSTHPKAAGETFLVSDGEDLSTPQLVKKISTHMERPARLIPVPKPLLKLGLSILGKRGVYERLCGNLTVDSSKIRNLLGWEPPFTVDQGLQQTVSWYLRSRQ